MKVGIYGSARNHVQGSTSITSAGTTVSLRALATATNTASGSSQHSGQVTYEF